MSYEKRIRDKALNILILKEKLYNHKLIDYNKVSRNNHSHKFSHSYLFKDIDGKIQGYDIDLNGEYYLKHSETNKDWKELSTSNAIKKVVNQIMHKFCLKKQDYYPVCIPSCDKSSASNVYVILLNLNKKVLEHLFYEIDLKKSKYTSIFDEKIITEIVKGWFKLLT